MQPDQNQDDHEPPAAGEPSVPPPVEPAPAEVTDQGADKNQQGPQKSLLEGLRARINWLTFLNVLVGIATIGQAFYAYRGLELTTTANQMTRESNDMTRDSIAFTKKSAKDSDAQADKSYALAEESLRAARESLKLEQRAWIGVTGISSTVPIKAGVQPEFRATVINAGKTPGLEIRSVMYSGPSRPTEQQILAERIGPKPKGMMPPSRTVLFPQATHFASTELNVPISENEIAAWKAGTATLYLFGNIRYKTISGEDGLTTYCWFVQKDLNSYRSCDHGNTAK